MAPHQHRARPITSSLSARPARSGWSLKAVSHASGHYSVRQITLQPLAFGSSHSRFLRHVARELPPGLNPRYFQDEQSLWTVIGVSGSKQEGLINEQGLLELGRGLPSIDAFVAIGDGAQSRLLTWHDGVHSQSLAERLSACATGGAHGTKLSRSV
jgi:hypothetical protein